MKADTPKSGSLFRNMGFAGALALCVGSTCIAVSPAKVLADSNQTLQTCSDPGHWFVRAISGNAPVGGGTGQYIDTPASPVKWVYPATWDEAAWAVNDNNIIDALEIGIFTGYFQYSGGYTNGMLTYYTLNNGTGAGHASTSVPFGTWVTIFNVGSGGYFYWSGADHSSFPSIYGISGPVVNLAQGEVTENTSTYMGDGTGYQNEAMWSPNGLSWYWWGSDTHCVNSPYWFDPGIGFGANGHAYAWTAGGT